MEDKNLDLKLSEEDMKDFINMFEEITLALIERYINDDDFAKQVEKTRISINEDIKNE